MRIRKMITVLLVAMALLTFSEASLGATTGVDEYYIICKPKVEINVRRRPNKKSSVIGNLMCGDSVRSDGKKKDGYIHVIDLTFEETEGWIYKGLLIREPPLIKQVDCQICAEGRVAARQYIDGKRNRWLRDGKGVTVYAIGEEWSITNYGYIQTRYLTTNYGKIRQPEDGD